MAKLKDYITITGGQIINRVLADEKKNDPVVDANRKTISAKTVDKGRIDDDNIVYNNYKSELDEKKLTKEGDIIVKLSTPYCAAVIDKDHEGMLVASFCSIIRDIKGINKDYLVAFLNSNNCYNQLASSVAGSTMSILSNGKIMDLDIPVPAVETQVEIGELFAKSVKRRILIEKITKLEAEKLDVMFAKLGE